MKMAGPTPSKQDSTEADAAAMFSSAMKTVQRVKSEWESTVDSVPQLICVVRKDGVVLRTNRTVEQWGLGAVGSVNGRSMHELMHPDCSSPECYLKRFLALSSKVLVTGEGVEYRGFDYILNRNFLIQLNPVGAGENDNQGHLVVIFRDISRMNLTGVGAADQSHWNLLHAAGTTEFPVEKGRVARKALAPASAAQEPDFKLIEKVKREWESAVDSLPQIICLLDESGSIVRANRAIEQWKLGDVTLVKGRKMHEMLHPGCEDPNCYLYGLNHQIGDVLATGRVAECQGQDVFLNRHLHFQINVFSSKHAPQGGLVVVLVSDVTDIRRAELKIEHLNNRLEKRIETRNLNLLKINQKLKKEIEQRKQVEAELRVSRQEYSLLVEMMNEGMVIQDITRKVTYVNRRLLKMLGLPRYQVVGRYFSDFVDGDYLEGWSGERLKSVKGIESAYVLKMKGRGGKSLWVKVSPQPLFDAGKQCVGSYAVITDINDHIEIEQKLLRTENQLRSISKQVLIAQELERKRIASELHDGLGQTLSAIKFYVENNIRNLSEPTSSIAQQFEMVIPKLQGAIEEVRRISMDLRPSLLDDIGVLATLSWFCRESKQAYPNIEFSFDKTNVNELEIPTALKTEIFRIVQEAVNNATKYSKAKTIAISLKDDNKAFRLEIRDDGIGFDYQALAAQQGYSESKGLGLASMRERVENSGGYFSVNTASWSGTAIACTWSKDGQTVLVERRTAPRDRRAKKRS